MANGAPKAKTTTPGPAILDLDSARAARAEDAGEAPVIKFGGQTFTLAVELPADFALLADAGDLRGAVSALLGDDAEAFFAWRPSMDDLLALVEGAAKVYGMAEGESDASPSS